MRFGADATDAPSVQLKKFLRFPSRMIERVGSCLVKILQDVEVLVCCQVVMHSRLNFQPMIRLLTLEEADKALIESLKGKRARFDNYWEETFDESVLWSQLLVECLIRECFIQRSGP